MKTIETTAVIGNDRMPSVQLPPDVAPNAHSIRVVIDELRVHACSRLDDFPAIDIGPWPQELSLKRQDLYGDGGR